MAFVIVGVMLAPWVILLTARRNWHVWARNVFIRSAACIAAGLAASWEPWIAPLALSVLLRWDGVAGLVPVLIWSAIFGMWFLGQALGPSSLVAAAWLTLAVLNVGLVVLQHVSMRFAVPAWLADGLDGMAEGTGTFGHRTVCGGFLAVTLPLCWLAPEPWRWALVALLAVGLWLTASWLAWLGVCAALGAMIPGARLSLIVLGAFVAVGGSVALWTWRRSPAWYFWVMRPTLDRWTQRGSSLDSIVQRLDVWRAYGRTWARWPNWLLGRGDGSSFHESVAVQGGVSQRMVGYPHNEVVTLAYEHGLFGVVALGLFLARLLPALAGGDPWSAAVIAGGVLMLGMHTAHIAPLGATWWLAAAMVTGR